MSSAVVQDTVADLSTLDAESREKIALELLASLYLASPADLLHLVHQTPTGSLYVLVTKRESLSQRAVNFFTKR